MSAARISVFLLLLFGLRCQNQTLSLQDVRQLFARPEYVTSGDGWAEARRRAVLKAYLRQKKIPHRETQQSIPRREGDKYRLTTVLLPAPGARIDARTLSVTLSLTRPGDQAACDERLFAALANLPALSGSHAVAFTMDERCRAESLTAQLDQQK